MRRSHRRCRFQSFIAPPALSFLILALASGITHAQQRETASDLLRKFNSVPYFWQQPDIARQIVALHDTTVLRELEPLLTDPDRHRRGNAALIFAGLGDKRGFEVITAILSDYSNRPEGQGFPGLPSVFLHPDPYSSSQVLVTERGDWVVREQIKADRYYAVHLLGELKDPRAVPILVPLLDDQDVNYNIPWALGQIGGPAAIKALIEALRNSRTEVRLYSIEALVTLRARQALPQIRQLVDDHEISHFGASTSVSDAARAAITKLEQSR